MNEGYVGCGVPYTAYELAFGGGQVPAAHLISTREGRNAELPYNYTSFITKRDVEVVSPNCLQCHGDTLNGELVIGLPNSRSDYTNDISQQAVLAGILITDPVEKEEWEYWKDRVVTVAPYTVTDSVGVNPADNIAAVLFAHRNQETLEWNDEPLLELPPLIVVPVDPPPWWHMRKKNAMFYTARRPRRSRARDDDRIDPVHRLHRGRGRHRRLLHRHSRVHRADRAAGVPVRDRPDPRR